MLSLDGWNEMISHFISVSRTDLTIFCEISVFEMTEKLADLKKSVTFSIIRLARSTVFIYLSMMAIHLLRSEIVLINLTPGCPYSKLSFF